MGSEFKLANLYMNQNMQYGNQFALNPSMYQNANAAVAGNYKLTIPQFNFIQPNQNLSLPSYSFNMPTFNNFSGNGFYNPVGSTSSTSSSNTDSYEARAKKEAEERKNRSEKSREEAQRKADEAKLSTVFKGYGLTKEQEEILLREHSKTFEPDMKLFGALGAGVGIGAVMKNNAIVSHPFNAVSTLGKNNTARALFKGNEELWKKSGNLMQEACYEMYKAERRHKKHWFGMWKKNYSDDTFNAMKDMMETAIRNNNADEIAKVTATFREINKNDGWLVNFYNKIRGKAKVTPDDIVNLVKNNAIDPEMAKSITNTATTLSKTANLTLGKSLSQAVGGKLGIIMSFAGILPEIQNYKLVKDKDKKLAKKQLWQSVVKFAANIGGYTLGEGLGTWAGAKLGALIGSSVPLVGTAIGALAGAICGTIVCHFAGKGAKKLMGDNVANKVKTQEVAKKADGADEIIQTLIAQARNGELKDEDALRIIQEIQQEQGQQIAVA